MRVKGPNGIVFDHPEPVAEALLRDEGFERVEDKPAAKKTAKPSPKK